MTLYEWECPDCEDVTNGCYPPKTCRCGQGLIIRDLTAQQEPTDYEAQLELQCTHENK